MGGKSNLTINLIVNSNFFESSVKFTNLQYVEPYSLILGVWSR